MTKEQFDSIMLLLTNLGLIAGGDVAIAKFFNYLEVRIKEKSLEPKRIKEFLEVLEKVTDRIDSLERNDTTQTHNISELKNDWRELLRQITENFLGRKK